MRYQPKGGMCMRCTHWLEDCSSLPFDRMPVIEQTADACIVRCMEYMNEAKQVSELATKSNQSEQ